MYFFLLKGGESTYFNICTFVCFCAYEYRQTSWENMNYSHFRSSAASIQMSQTFLLGPQHCNETCISAHLSIFTYHVDPSWIPWTPAAPLICIYFHFLIFLHYLSHFLLEEIQIMILPFCVLIQTLTWRRLWWSSEKYISSSQAGENLFKIPYHYHNRQSFCQRLNSSILSE